MKKTQTKVLAYVLTLMMLIGLIPVFSLEVKAADEPVLVDGYYQIANEADLLWFREKVDKTEDETAAAALKAKLTADITLTTEDAMGEPIYWEPIGHNFSAPFRGELDGQNHRIDGLQILAKSNFKGFIARNEGIVQNLVLAGEMQGDFSRRRNNFASVVAYNKGGTVYNVRSEVNINFTGSSSNLGGIVGNNLNEGIVSNCIFNGTINADNTQVVGGIVGYLETGTVVGNSFQGGILNNAMVGQTGGIAGNVGCQNGIKSYLIHNYSNGTIAGKDDSDMQATAGIVGKVAAPSNAAGYHNNVLIEVVSNYSVAKLSGQNLDGIVSNPYVTSQAPDYYKYQNNYQLVEAGANLPADEPGSPYKPSETYRTEDQMKAPEFIDQLNSMAGALEVQPEQMFAENGQDFPRLAYEPKAVDPADIAYLDEAIKKLGYNARFAPFYPQDKNINEALSAKLAEYGFPGITAEIESINDMFPDDGRAELALDGTITYFYRDPDDIMVSGTFEPLWWRRIRTNTKLTYNTASKVVENLQNQIHWDHDKARSVLQEKVIDQVTDEVMLNGNAGREEVVTDLVLPKTVINEALGKRRLWSIISWTSSDENVISIDASNQGTADTLFEPYIGKVNRQTEDKTVTLTAHYSFQYGKRPEDTEAIEQEREYTFVVKAYDATAELKAEMQKELDDKYLATKFKYFRSDEPVDPAAVHDDIKFIIPSETGIANYDNYTFAITSHKENVIKPNAYRGMVYRPLPGKPAEDVTLTVTMTHKEHGVSVKKDIVLTVVPLEQKEIDDAVALMEKAKAEYFAGINDSRNTDAEHIEQDLHSFLEVRWADSDMTNLHWIYDIKNANEHGVIPVLIDESFPSEKWAKFRSSRPDIIAHENLLVTKPQYNTEVTIDSVLSHEVFAKYAELYPDNADFQKLYRQPVNVKVIVLGTDGEAPQPIEKIKGTLTLVGARVLEDPDTEPDMPKYMYWEKDVPFEAEPGQSAWDVTVKTLNDLGYKVETSIYGGHIQKLTKPDGIVLEGGVTNGERSTWLWLINDEFAQVGADQHFVKEGDKIRWYFNNDWNDMSYMGFPEKYEPLNGWVEDWSKNKYYYVNGVYVVGLQTIDDAEYLFNKQGIMQTGWHVIGGKQLYFDPATGKMLKGIQKIGKTVYLLTEQGKQTGWHVIDGKALYFDPQTGGMLTGLRKLGKTTYLLTAEGKQTGWHVINGKELYFDPQTGGMLTGKRLVGNTTYLLTAEGKACGWHVLSGEKYYFDQNYGCGMLTGLRNLGKATYFFRVEESEAGKNNRGAALCDDSIIINGKTYTFNVNGALIN